jgi:uncharacterized protein (TIGR03083 family)
MRPTQSSGDRDHADAALPRDATQISALGHEEATALAYAEFARFLALVEDLPADAWGRPTACSLWDVRQVVAHVAGAAAGYARWREFGRQYGLWAQRPYRRAGRSYLDALNQIQVDDRAGASPGDLIAELEAVVPRAIITRRRLPATLRALRLPLPALGLVRIDYLTDLIYTRDMWMHRLDLCRAAGRTMALTTAHDGRIIALVVHDLAQQLARSPGGDTVIYELTGTAGGTWRLGGSTAPAATIRMDALDFNLLASGRITPAEAQMLPATEIRGDPTVAVWALENTSVVY